jgi:transcription antitermination factor NusG
LSIIERKWFVLYTKPKHELKAAIQIENLGVEYYLPTLTIVKRWSDRKKKVDEPIFKGYIFIYANEKERLNSMAFKEIVRCVSFLGKPAVVPDWEIQNLKTFLEHSSDFIVTDLISTGTKVRIVDGLFKDVTGIVSSINGENYLSVSVDMLHRSVSVKLPKESIIKIVEK